MTEPGLKEETAGKSQDNDMESLVRQFQEE